MIIRFLLFTLGLAGAGLLAAHEGGEWTPGEEPVVRLSMEELEELLAPVALHPDALIALILPAATHPAEIVLAARRLARDANPVTLETEPWDDSVRALARYPEMLAWMDENLAWTQQVGEVFLAQPAEVMTAIQRLRERARANGTLTDSPEQQVVVGEEHIRIVPTRPEVIYVPRYDPAVVYVSRPYTYPVSCISFGAAYPAGHWLAYDFDWRFRTFWVVPPPQRVVYWRERSDWRHRYHAPLRPDGRDPYWHAWQPRPTRPHAYQPRPTTPRPPHHVASPPRAERPVTPPQTWRENRPTPQPTHVRETPRPRPTQVTPTPSAPNPNRWSSGRVERIHRPERRPDVARESRPRPSPPVVHTSPSRPAVPAPVATPPRPPRERPTEAARPRTPAADRSESRPPPPSRPAADLPRPPAVPADDDTGSPTPPRRERHR